MLMTWSIDVHRLVLRLLEQLDHPVAAVELLLGGLVELGAELGERLELAEGRQVEPQAAGDLLHRRDLGLAADPRDADARRRPPAGRPRRRGRAGGRSGRR